MNISWIAGLAYWFSKSCVRKQKGLLFLNTVCTFTWYVWVERSHLDTVWCRQMLEEWRLRKRQEKSKSLTGAVTHNRYQPLFICSYVLLNLFVSSLCVVSAYWTMLQFLQRSALQALYMQRKSFVRPRICVTLQYCVKMSKHRGMWFSPSGSPVSSFVMPRMVDGGWPSPVKIWVQRGRPHAKTVELYTFSLITPEL